MGRKIKPRHLKRDHVSISLPLDVIMYLDKYASRTGGTRSRFIERLIRASMLKAQRTLNTILTHWVCSGCGHSWSTKDTSLEFVFCESCNRQQKKEIDFKGQTLESNVGEEE